MDVWFAVGGDSYSGPPHVDSPACSVSLGPAAVIAMCAVSLPGGPALIASTQDGSLHFVQADAAKGTAEVSFVHSVGAGRKGVVSLAANCLLGVEGSALIAGGCMSGEVQVLVADVAAGRFQPLGCLVGHSDWVRSVHWGARDSTDDKGAFLLVSGGQDSRIRVWVVTPTPPGAASPDPHRAATAIAGADMSLLSASAVDLAVPDIAPALFTRQSAQSWGCTAVLDSVISGHEDWITCVRWWPCPSQSASQRIISVSADKSCVLWDGVVGKGEAPWQPSVRVGGISGRATGIAGCAVSSDGTSLVTHGHAGDIHLWRLDQADPTASTWDPVPVPCGHSAAINDMQWDQEGAYLLSASSDKTVRAWSHVKPSAEVAARSLHEIGRPLVHGHEVRAICQPRGAVPDHTLVVASAEKVLRAFNATQAFLAHLRGSAGEATKPEDAWLSPGLPRPYGALVPELGLSVLATGGPADGSSPAPAPTVDDVEARLAVEQELKDAALQGRAVPAHAASSTPQATRHAPEATFTIPERQTYGLPTVDELMSEGQWVESRKLYAHGNDVVAVAASPCGRTIVSTCEARSYEHAQVQVWDSASWSPQCRVGEHTGTVAKLCFSPCGRLLAAVSKDRHVSLFAHDPNASGSGRLTQLARFAGHKRAVTAVAWKAVAGLRLVTGCRGGKVKTWLIEGLPEDPAAPLNLEVLKVSAGPQLLAVRKKEVASLACAPACLGGFLAVGLDSGETWLVEGVDSATARCLDLVGSSGPAVTALAWHPSEPGTLAIGDAEGALALVAC